MQISKGEEVEINIVGSSSFGIYPKISLENVYNMYQSDGWMVNYAGFKKIQEPSTTSKGRGLFNSILGGFIILVVGPEVFRLGTNLLPLPIGTISTTTGDVYIDENLAGQICIVDGINAYIYNYTTIPVTFVQQSLPFQPGYVCYHNTYFLFGSVASNVNASSWYVYEPDSILTSNIQPVIELSLETKPDAALLVERLPGRGNNVIVMGSTVAEIWTQVPGDEVYRRVQSFNIDNGIVSVSTLASNEEFVCWIGQNENNAPFLMFTDGAAAKRISTDGIDNILAQIKYPTQSTAFFFRQDGHLFYQFTFYNPTDNLTLVYDFTTQSFFHASDQLMNYHPAREVVYFNEETYFISLNDGGLYQMDNTLLTYNYQIAGHPYGEEIPRIRICKAIRKKDSGRFRIGQFTFWIEQGMVNLNPSALPQVDMSISKNGGQSFSNVVSRVLNPAGIQRNQIRWWRMGQANEFIIQLRFYGFTRMVVSNGVAEIF